LEGDPHGPHRRQPGTKVEVARGWGAKGNQGLAPIFTIAKAVETRGGYQKRAGGRIFSRRKRGDHARYGGAGTKFFTGSRGGWKTNGQRPKNDAWAGGL